MNINELIEKLYYYDKESFDFINAIGGILNQDYLSYNIKDLQVYTDNKFLTIRGYGIYLDGISIDYTNIIIPLDILLTDNPLVNAKIFTIKSKINDLKRNKEYIENEIIKSELELKELVG